jgi:hypothetical protein
LVVFPFDPSRSLRSVRRESALCTPGVLALRGHAPERTGFSPYPFPADHRPDCFAMQPPAKVPHRDETEPDTAGPPSLPRTVRTSDMGLLPVAMRQARHACRCMRKKDVTPLARTQRVEKHGRHALSRRRTQAIPVLPEECSDGAQAKILGKVEQRRWLLYSFAPPAPMTGPGRRDNPPTSEPHAQDFPPNLLQGAGRRHRPRGVCLGVSS